MRLGRIFIFFTFFASQAHSAVLQPLTKWSDTEIPVRVCWGNWGTDFDKLSEQSQNWASTSGNFDFEKSKSSEFSQETKKLIEDIVNSEFTPYRTVIHFVGWQSCEDDPQAPLVKILKLTFKLLGV